jgi:hypothetical protein
MLKISDDFTMDDIRAIRDDFYERYKDNWDHQEMIKEINAGAKLYQDEINAERAVLGKKPA